LTFAAKQQRQTLNKNDKTKGAGVRFADMHLVTRSITLDAPISATAILGEIAEELVRVALADHPDEKTVSLLAISLSHLEQHWKLQLELPETIADHVDSAVCGPTRHPFLGTRPAHLQVQVRMGCGRIRGSVVLGPSRSVPDEFRELAEKNL
jgi:DNA polymerase-4